MQLSLLVLTMPICSQKVQSFASDVEPDSAAFLASVEKLLAEK
jgi:hypothetical protein